MSQEPLEAKTLDDLGLVPIVITLKRPDGRRINVTLRALSEGEVWEIRKAIKWPRPPVSDFDKSGGRVNPIYDYSDETYQNAVREADRLLAQRMLLAGLVLDIPGETEDERLAALVAKLGQYAFTTLVDAARRINIVSAEEIAATAASFRPVGDTRASSHDAAGAVARAVASRVESGAS